MDRLTIQDGNIGFVDNSQLPSYAALYEKLRKYEDLEEQGRLLKLPCAVGNMVYTIRLDNAAYMICNKKIWEIVKERFEIRHFDCIGKTVFLTRPEAERALEEIWRERMATENIPQIGRAIKE